MYTNSRLLLMLTFVTVSLCRTTSDLGNVNSVDDDGGRRHNNVVASNKIVESNFINDMRLLYRVYEECSAKEISSCLKTKIIFALDRAEKSIDRLKLTDGISFVRDESRVDERLKSSSPLLTEKDLEQSLPRSLDDRENTLNDIIIEKIIRFFQTHTLQFKLIGSEQANRSLSPSEEGRARRKGANSLLMMSTLLLGGTLIPLSFGALALLAGKALIVSKLALALAAIIGLKKLVSGSGGGGESYQVVTVPSHSGGGHYRRSFQDVHDDSHTLSYRGYVPAVTDVETA